MRQNTVERRTELLKMEGLGFSESEIVTDISQKFHKDPRTIYRDLETRDRWQLTGDAYKHYLKAYNRLDQAFKRAGAIYLMNSNNANAQLGAIRIMTDIAIEQVELSGYKIPVESQPDLDTLFKRRLDTAIHKKVEENMTKEEYQAILKYSTLYSKFQRYFEEHPELIPPEERIH